MNSDSTSCQMYYTPIDPQNAVPGFSLCPTIYSHWEPKCKLEKKKMTRKHSSHAQIYPSVHEKHKAMFNKVSNSIKILPYLFEHTNELK